MISLSCLFRLGGALFAGLACLLAIGVEARGAELRARSGDATIAAWDAAWKSNYEAARYPQVIAASMAGLARAEQIGHVGDQLLFLGRLAYDHWLIGNSEFVIDYCQRMLRTAEPVGDEVARACAHRYLSLVYETLGDASRARTHAETAQRHAVRAGDEELRIMAVEAAAAGALLGGDGAAARRGFTAVRDYWRGRGWRWNTANSDADLARVTAQEGDLTGALAAMEEVLAARRSFADRRGQARALGQIAGLLRRLGRADAAQQRMEEARPLVAEIGGDKLQAEFQAECAAVAEARGELAAALAAGRLAAQAQERLAGARAHLRAADFSTQIEQERQERQERLRAAEARGAAAELARVRTLRWVLVGGLSAGVLVLGAVIRLQRARLGAERVARAAAETADRLKTNFLGIASHDLRAPLRSLARYAEQIARAPRDEAAVGELAGRIRRESDRMGELVRDLIDVAALESGGLRLRLAPLDLAALAAESVAAHEPLAQRKEQTLTLAVTPEGPVFVSADPPRLRQVLDNLLDNAIKFTPVGRAVRVHVTAESGVVRVAVADEGPGLQPEDFAAMFEPFRPLSARPTGGEPSRGLGLAIVRELVQLHGGQLTVDTDPGGGATFTVVLRATAPVE